MPVDEAALRQAVEEAFPDATSIQRVGCGGFACTFRVRHDGDDLAIKVIDPDQVTDPLREEREVLALRSVRHPNVVRYRGTGTVDSNAKTYRYLIMDFVDGETLGQRFAAGYTFSADESATLAEDIVAGAAAIWQAGLAHRDLSPSNVMVKADGHALIVDLGIARHLNLPTITTTLPTPGTPGWMSPEQVDANPERGDWQSDQFVIGLLLYRLTAGVDPYNRATSIIDLWRAPVERTPLPVRFLSPATPRRIAEVISRLIEKVPYERYRQGQDLVDDVATAAAELRGAPGAAPDARPVRFLLSLGKEKSYCDDDGFRDQLRPEAIIIDARNVRPDDVPTWMSRAGEVDALGLVDPTNYFDQSPPGARPAFYQRLPYEDQARPAITGAFASDVERAAYVRPIVEYQVNANVSAIVAPYFYAGVAQADRLDESLRMGPIAAGILADDDIDLPVWTALAVADDWLRETRLPALLSSLSHHRPSTLYLMVSTDQTTARPHGDAEVLLGARALIELMDSMGRAVIAGRRYSSGLLLGVLGASGWSTGNDGTLQNFQPPPTQAEDGGGGPPADWFYVPKLLNSIKLATRAVLVGAHPQIFAPSDSYDTELFSHDPALAALNTAQRLLLHRHNLFSLRRQASSLNGQSPAQRVDSMREWVAEAKRSYQTLGHAWDPGEGPEFLEAWEAVL